MSGRELHLLVPGPLDQRTGGYVYDARIVAGLRGLGWSVEVHSLVGVFPDADTRASRSLSATLAGLPDGARVVIDGLAMGGLPEPVRAARERLRILALVHHPLADETGLDAAHRARLTALEREALGGCAGVLVTSEFTAARLGAYGVAPARVRAVRPGTDPVRLAEGPGLGEPPVLLCVASVIPRKGQDVLVRALARLRDMPWTGVCAGSLDRAPGYARTVQALAVGAGLADRVRFVGECEPASLDDHYHHASLFVLPSHYEGYGMALAEALARGLPVVSTTGGAIPHTVPADAGLLVPPGDVAALAAALRRVMADETTHAALAAAAQRHARRLPDWSQAARAFAAATLELTPDGAI